MHQLTIPRRLHVCRNLVNGAWQEGTLGEAEIVRSPYNGAAVSSLRYSSESDVANAVRAAESAFPDWQQTPLKERSKILFQFRALLLEHLTALAEGVAVESGKTLVEARQGLEKGIEVLEFALSLQNLDSGGALEVSRGVTCEYRREPLGVVAGVTPFNFPAMVPLWLFPIAIALGNCFILKPSEKVPQTACRLGELLLEAGLPPGVFSILHGAKATAEALARHSGVRALAFVGSTAAAGSLYALATSTGKRALCLGGAKNQLIVVPDADESVTIEGVVSSFTGCAGQRCMAGSVLLAVGEIDSLIEKICRRAAAVRLGEDMGAIIDPHARQRIVEAISEAERNGAHVILDGRRAEPPSGYDRGNWLGPTILDFASPSMACSKTEIFGPVLTVVRVRSLSEALDFERENAYGNATSVFTTSGAIARHVAQNATSGMIGVNVGVPVPREPFSFGGTKSSKFGAGDITGEGSLDLWSNRKKITSKWALQCDTTWMG